MKHSYILAVTASLGLNLLVAGESTAEETRQHGKHEHGAAEMLIAIEGDQLQISLESPAYNLLGFEVAGDDMQRETVYSAYDLLKLPAELFVLDGVACTSVSTEVEGELFEEGHDAEHMAEEHKEDHKDEHNNESAEEHDKDAHAEEHEEGHEDGHEGGHSDVLVQWSLQCENLEQLQQLQVNLFQQFEHLKSLDVQYLVGQKQGAQQLSIEQSVLQF